MKLITTFLLATALVGCKGTKTFYYKSDMDEAYKFLLFEAAKKEQVEIKEVDEIPFYGSSVEFNSPWKYRQDAIAATFVKYAIFDLKSEIHIRKRTITPSQPQAREIMFQSLVKELRK